MLKHHVQTLSQGMLVVQSGAYDIFRPTKTHNAPYGLLNFLESVPVKEFLKSVNV